MTEKEFMSKIANGQRDLLQEFVGILKKNEISFCIIGGLAVNAYAEPVISLDLDIVVAATDSDLLLKNLPKEYSIKKEKHSVNISVPFSDLRIQLHSDNRYQEFTARAAWKTVIGYDLPVAIPEDVLQGKLWAYSDPERRPSKRQKDLADIMRLVEAIPKLRERLPDDIRRQFI